MTSSEEKRRRSVLDALADDAEYAGLEDIAALLRRDIPALTKSEMDGTAGNGLAIRYVVVREHWRKYWSRLEKE